MKVNKEVSNLARKLDFIGIEQEDRRRMIKICLNPFRLISGCYLIFQINESYAYLKKEVEEYQKLDEEKRRIGEIKYIALLN